MWVARSKIYESVNVRSEFGKKILKKMEKLIGTRESGFFLKFLERMFRS